MDANGHQISFIINSEGIAIESNKKLTLDVATSVDLTSPEVNVDSENVTVDSTNVTIKGGQFNMKGSVPPQTSGPLNAMIICPFTGAPHAGELATGT